MAKHQYQDIITIFNNTFYSSFNTQLVLGSDEPVYLPANSECSHHRILFAHGFYRSALHEIAHWLVASQERRLLEDYGYWYEPDGRNAAQQAEFEKVEIVPQAIEWALSNSCGIAFDVSVDNLSGEAIDRAGFKSKVRKQVNQYLQQGFSSRTNQLLNACHVFYQTPRLTVDSFKNKHR